MIESLSSGMMVIFFSQRSLYVFRPTLKASRSFTQWKNKVINPCSLPFFVRPQLLLVLAPSSFAQESLTNLLASAATSAVTAKRKTAKELTTVQPRKKRRRWTEEEENALRHGVQELGVGSWAQILAAPQFSCLIQNRSGQDCKDKWRNMSRASNPELPSIAPSPPLSVSE